jgi:predicted P-loop ATPase
MNYNKSDSNIIPLSSSDSNEMKIQEIRNYLPYIAPDTLHVCITIGRAIEYETGGSPMGFDEWHEWCKKSSEYLGENACRDMWLMFKKHTSSEPVTIALITHLYIKALVKIGQFNVINQLDRDKKDEIKKTTKNARLMLLYGASFGEIQFDEMKFNETINNVQITRYTILKLGLELDEHYGTAFPKSKIHEAVMLAGQQNKINPVQDYLYSLSWDGISRLNEFLIQHAGAIDCEYTEIVTSKTLIAAVARAFAPGCKVDTTLVLEGPQGCRKSTLIRSLSPEANWFSDTELPIGYKDSYQQLHGIWMYEIAEMSSVAKASKNTLKSFLTSSVDKFRIPGTQLIVDSLRRNIFIGTTNDDEYLNDESGARRFWPLKVNNIDIEEISRIRDQLWAEATYRYFQDEPWHLDKAQEQLAMHEQSLRFKYDAWEDDIKEWIDKNGINEATGKQIFKDVFGLPKAQFNRNMQFRIAAIMRHIGWQKKTLTLDGMKVSGYQKPQGVDL